MGRDIPHPDQVRYDRHYKLSPRPERGGFQTRHAFRAENPRTPVAPGHEWLIAKGEAYVDKWRLRYSTFMFSDDDLAMEFRLRWG